MLAKRTPLKISVFLWKLLHNAIPTDYAINKKGIALPLNAYDVNFPTVLSTMHIFSFPLRLLHLSGTSLLIYLTSVVLHILLIISSGANF